MLLQKMDVEKHEFVEQSEKINFFLQRSCTLNFLHMVIYAWFVYKQTDTQLLPTKITRNLVSEVNYVGMVALIIQLFVTTLQVA